MDAAIAIKTPNILKSSSATELMANTTNLFRPSWLSSRPEMLKLSPYGKFKSSSRKFSSHPRGPFPNSRSNTKFVTRCSSKPGIDSNNATNRNNQAIELDSNPAAQHLAAATAPNQALTSTCSKGLGFSLGPKNSWDNGEIGSPIVKRYIGDNEERWYMWYHGRSDENSSDSTGLAVSSNGIHWTRGEDHPSSCGNEGLVMDCGKNWWAFDTRSIRPSELVLMSSSMYSAVYWLYYTGYSSEEVDLSGVPNISLENPETVQNQKQKIHAPCKIFKSLPGLACSQDGRHWARIEGDHHSGALFDVGSSDEWDSLFIAAPQVVVHSSDDLRMYYHSFDVTYSTFSIGIARSRDGIRWVKMGKIMGGGSNGSFDEFGVKNACVRRNQKDGNYIMAYEGVATDGKRSIGLAASPDGIKNWRRIQENPVLRASEDDGWDNNGVGSPCLVHMEGNRDEWRLYYVGVGHGGKTGIGMAVSDGSNVSTFGRWEGFHL